jgi:hypothetical protein
MHLKGRVRFFVDEEVLFSSQRLRAYPALSQQSAWYVLAEVRE